MLIHEIFGQIIEFNFEQYSPALLALNLRNAKGDPQNYFEHF